MQIHAHTVMDTLDQSKETTVWFDTEVKKREHNKIHSL